MPRHVTLACLLLLAVVTGLRSGGSWNLRPATANTPTFRAGPLQLVQTAGSRGVEGDIGRYLQHAGLIATSVPRLHGQLSTFTMDDAWALEELHLELAESTKYTGHYCQELLRLALEVSYLAHNGQKRKSGEPYIIHPVAVASILAESHLDVDTVVSGLLHDTVEDTMLMFEDIELLFGPDVRKIVEGETKVSKLPKMVRSELATQKYAKGTRLEDTQREVVETSAFNKQDEQVENLRSMFVAMAEDWRIVIVKLADRLHNMRTLEFMPPHKRISIARETLEIFAPLAHRLGMWSFRSELADLSLKFLFPTEHAQLEDYIASQRIAYEATLEAATLELTDRLCYDPRLLFPDGDSRVTITGRTKNIHSTWKKLQRRNCGVGEVLDLVALRIVIDTSDFNAGGLQGGGGSGQNQIDRAEEEAICYHVLGKVHSIWTPLPRTLKDYISSPKPNGYRSLHTTVLVGTQPLEVQIRTQAMHAIAEFGAAAHWAYTEGKDVARGSGGGKLQQAADAAATEGAQQSSAEDVAWERKRAWMQSSSSSSFSTSIAKWGQDVECAHEFMQLVRQELLGTRVFVFTESGGSTRILNLARGATLGDAARLIGTSSSTHVPLISGSPADLSTQLSNGEIVSFIDRGTLELGTLPSMRGSPAVYDPSVGSGMGGGMGGGSLGGGMGGGSLGGGSLGAGGMGGGSLGGAATRDGAGRVLYGDPVSGSSGGGFGEGDGGGFGEGGGGELAAGSAEDADEAGRQMAGASGARNWRVCTRCLPLPGDALVCTTHSIGIDGLDGESAGGLGAGAAGAPPEKTKSLTLHRANCECLALRRQMAAGERLIRPTPALTEQYRAKLDAALSPFSPDGSYSTRRNVYTTKVIVFTTDRPGLLLAVSSVVTAESLNILDVHSKTWEVGVGSAFQYKVLIADVEQLERLIVSLESLDDVVRVVRGDMEDMLHDLGPELFWQNARPQ